MAWGGRRPGAGRKPRPTNSPKPVDRPALKASPKVLAPAEPKTEMTLAAIDPRAWQAFLPQLEEISKRYAHEKYRTPANNPFQLPKFPDNVVPKDETLRLAMDSSMTWASNQWLAGEVIAGLPAEGMLFLGYPYLSELAQRPEYRVMTETIADDATRKWIDFDVVGDKRTQQEERAKDPEGYDERMADPDQRKKRIQAAGRLDRVKALKDDQLRLDVKLKMYEQARNDGFFGRSHAYLDIRTTPGAEPTPDELMTDIGDGRDERSKSKVPLGSFKAIRTIEPVWTYPMMYNAINPLREDWYNPQVWYVMGQQLHLSRLPTFIGHPVPDLLKPAYSFGGLSLSQMAKPYVDIWLQTRQSVADLIHSFSVMVLMTDLSTLLQPGNANALLARVAMFNMLRDNQGTFVVNKNSEDFKNVSAQLSGLHELQAQAQEHMASVHRIPLVKFTGIQPAGLNASSEGEIEVYDDTIGAYQTRFFDANLRRIIYFEMLSLWGEIDPEITYHWEKLREITQAEKGQKEKDDADRDVKYIDAGVLAPEEVRRRIIDDADMPYADLDPDDVPEPPQEEGLDEPGAPENDNEPGHDQPPRKEAGAQDSLDPFGATDEWREEEHPRAPDGKFGSGGGSASIAGGEKQKLKMPQFGLTPTPWEPHQLSTWKPRRERPAMPSSSGDPHSPSGILAFKPGEDLPLRKLNGIGFSKWKAPKDADGWNAVAGQAEIGEPPLPDLPKGMTMSTGVVIREPDGRVWIMRPSKGFGGYDQTFPKGGLEDGINPQANAIKEAWEETGLKVRITGFAGDHEGDTTVSRFYFAEREGGTPRDAGWEAEGVILAPADRLSDFLNRSRDRNIAAALAPPASTPLDPKKLTKLGGKLGSNEGGTFKDESGRKFYIKRPETKAHVANELAAARLYQLAGVRTLDYRPVEGGNHVATEWAKLDKANIKDFTPAERREAAKDFAVHAWLSNWDAAGTGGDNQGIRNGKPTTLDVGGSLRYRAQGSPKGAAFGSKVSELDTMRDPSKSYDAAKLFGPMTDDEIKASVERVTSIPDAAIRASVGDDSELAETLIARKRDMAKRFELQAADEAPFNESDHPRAPDGKFTSGGGGGSSGSMNETEIFALSAKKPIAGSNYRKALVKAIGLTTNEATKKKLAANLAMSWAKTGANAFEKGDAVTGQKIGKKLTAISKEHGIDVFEATQVLAKAMQAAKPAPQKVEIKEPAKAEPSPAPAVSFPKPTEAELQKAKKSVALQMQYVPGAKPEIASGEPYKMAEKIIKAFNDKWAGKEGLTDAQLAEKVNHFKSMSPAMAQLAQQEKTHYAEIAKKAVEEKAKKNAAEAAKIAAEMAEHKEHYDILKGIGYAGNTGSSAKEQINQVKMFWNSAAATIQDNKLPITPQQGAYIAAYVGAAYGEVNKQLRKGTVTVEQWKYAAALDDAIDKMPKYEGTIYRGADLSIEQFEKYKNAVGKVIPEPGFQSYGVKTKLWGTYNFVTKSKTARDIRAFNPGEGGGEVLFKNNTPFFVEKVVGNTIYLAEV